MKKILLVDDMRHSLDLASTFLSRADCGLLTASTGLEAIRVARAEKPALIVLDIEMPEMNGIQACRILKADPATRDIPIVMLTSMQMEDESRRAGANHFLRKPIDETRFLDEVKRFVPIVERPEPRVPSDMPVTFWRDGQSAQGQITNASRSGFYVETLDPQSVGARLEVSFSLPQAFAGKLITAEVMVVRLGKGPSGFGCRLFQISDGTRLYLEEFIEKSAAGDQGAKGWG